MKFLERLAASFLYTEISSLELKKKIIKKNQTLKL